MTKTINQGLLLGIDSLCVVQKPEDVKFPRAEIAGC